MKNVVLNILKPGLACMCLTLTAQAQSLITNGSFENGDPSYVFTGWDVSSIQSGDGATSNWGAAEGIFVAAFHQGGEPTGGSISQSFTTTIGQVYQLTFYATNFAGFDTALISFNTQIQGATTLLDVDNNPMLGGQVAPYTIEDFSTYSYFFTADSILTTLRFTDTSTGGPNEDLFIDAVAVTAVPEPTTLALITASLVGVVLLRKRRVA